MIYKAKTLDEISYGMNINSEVDQRPRPGALQCQDEGEEEKPTNKTEKEHQ